jgi:hypothetical protein
MSSFYFTLSVLAQDLDPDPCRSYDNLDCSIGDSDPQDPHVFGPPGSINQRYGSGSGSGSFAVFIVMLSGLK